MHTWLAIAAGALGLALGMSAGFLSGAEPPDAPHVRLAGRLQTGVVAIGGETTGTTISTPDFQWELELTSTDLRRQAETLHGRQVVVAGKLRKVPGVERGERWIVRVETLEPAEAASPDGEPDVGGQAEMEVRAASSSAQLRLMTTGVSTIDIHSPTGIGRATVGRSGERWPQPILLHLHLRGLENIKITAGSMVLERWNGQNPWLLGLRKTDSTRREDHLPSATPIWVHPSRDMIPKVPLESGYFEIVLPPALLLENPPTMEIEWVDFYR